MSPDMQLLFNNLMQANNANMMTGFEKIAERMLGGGAGGGAGGGGEKKEQVTRRPILDNRNFEGLPSYEGGEEGWKSWAHKMKVVVRPLCEELVELMEVAEDKPGKKWAEIVDDLLDTEDGKATAYQKELIRKTSGELYSVLMLRTTGDANLVVERVTALDGLEAWGELHKKYNQKTMGRMFRQQRECMYPKAVQKLDEVESGVMEWEQKWRRMEKDLGLSLIHI